MQVVLLLPRQFHGLLYERGLLPGVALALLLGSYAKALLVLNLVVQNVVGGPLGVQRGRGDAPQLLIALRLLRALDALAILGLLVGIVALHSDYIKIVSVPVLQNDKRMN